MKRIFIIIGGVLGAILLVVLGYYAVSRTNEGAEPISQEEIPGAVLPPAPNFVPEAIPTGDRIRVGTPEGIVAIRNVYRNPVAAEPGVYVLASRNADYDLAYFPDTTGFVVALNQGPVEEVIRRIEADVPGNLGISAEDACKLDLVIIITRDIDENRAGEERRLSFCEGKKGVYNRDISQ